MKEERGEVGKPPREKGRGLQKTNSQIVYRGYKKR
jgi:hypothetical protein